MFDIELFKFLGVFLKDTGLLPVVLFALLLKVYVINGNINKHFSALRRERRLLRGVISRIDRLIDAMEKNPCVKEGEKKE